MNSIILCEGETDQVLISYYFIKNFGFEYYKKAKYFPSCTPKKLNPQNESEAIWSYYRGEDNLIIWAVGGHDDCFERALEKVLYQNKINSPTNGVYSRICIVTDHDSNEELINFWKRINQCLANYGIEIGFQEAECISTFQDIGFGQRIPISLLGLPVPLTESGALETLLLNALSEDAGNSYIVEKSRDVVRDLLDNIDKFSDSYLSTRREQIKAPLAVFLGVTVPERTFDGMKKMMESIPWDNYQAIREMFAAFDVFKEDGM